MDCKPSDYDTYIEPIQEQMLRSIWRITQAAEDAEDALQESLTIIWKRWTRIRRHPHPRALVLRICVNCAYDALRARLRRKSREQLLVDPDMLPATDCSVHQRLSRQELREDVVRALMRLPKRQSVAVVMRYILELSYEEISDALGCSQSTARVHVDRARKRLSQLLSHSPSSCSNGKAP